MIWITSCIVVSRTAPITPPPLPPSSQPILLPPSFPPSDLLHPLTLACTCHCDLNYSQDFYSCSIPHVSLRPCGVPYSAFNCCKLQPNNYNCCMLRHTSIPSIPHSSPPSGLLHPLTLACTYRCDLYCTLYSYSSSIPHVSPRPCDAPDSPPPSGAL